MSSSSLMRIGVIGYGYWGPNLVRNFADLDACRLVAVCDRDAARVSAAERRYPGVRGTTDARKLIEAPDVDAVVIATPVAAHYDLTSAALEAGKHVLVEKPLASSGDEAERLIGLAGRRKRVLMVDHTFVYTGAVRKMRELLVA